MLPREGRRGANVWPRARYALGRTNRRSLIDRFPARLKSFEFRSTAAAMSTTACRFTRVDPCSRIARCPRTQDCIRGPGTRTACHLIHMLIDTFVQPADGPSRDALQLLTAGKDRNSSPQLSIVRLASDCARCVVLTVTDTVTRVRERDRHHKTNHVKRNS